jgi:GNAT superfamily N-acetyltransferase
VSPDPPVALADFETHADAVTALLRAYHETVAERFAAWLAARDAADEFDAGAYVAGELATDRAALRPLDSAPLVLAWDGDRAVGCVYLYERTPETAEVKRLYVRESHRGRGLGATLVETLVRAARDAGYGTLRLDTAPFMDRARRLYRTLGFEPFDGADPVTDVPAPLRDEIVYLRRRLDDEV